MDDQIALRDFVRVRGNKLTWTVLHMGRQADPICVIESGLSGRRERYLLSQLELYRKVKHHAVRG